MFPSKHAFSDIQKYRSFPRPLTSLRKAEALQTTGSTVTRYATTCTPPLSTYDVFSLSYILTPSLQHARLEREERSRAVVPPGPNLTSLVSVPCLRL